MASLYGDNWRQGTVFDATLPLDAVVWDEVSRQPVRATGSHDRWVVATQDCDLDLTENTNEIPTIELRPVHSVDPPTDWGIRSSKLLLAEQEYITSTSPRTIVSAAVLTAIKENDAIIRQLAPERRVAYTTWLGLRYDRPAVPPEFIPLAKKIAEVVTKKRNRATGARVRDVLMQIQPGDPMRYSLFAVLDNEEDEDEVREWLSAISLEVPVDLGVADEIEAASARRISLELIETAYSADVSQLTWRPNSRALQGAS
jgi:hypothetical protein